MRQKLITLAVGALVAAVLALPALAAGPGGGAGKRPIPAACKQAAIDAIQAFRSQQKAARQAFRSQQPRPTPDQVKAFRQQQRDAVKAFRQSELASIKTCAANA